MRRAAAARAAGARTAPTRRTAPVRHAALGLLAAALLAGCATGTPGAAPEASATPATTAASGGTDTTAPSGGTAAPDPSRSPAGRTPEGTLLVADFGADTVTFVDPGPDGSGRGGAPIASVKAGTAPYGLVVGEDGRAWVATAEGVAVVDTRQRTRLALIPYATESGPVTTGEYRGGGMGIAMAPDGGHVYVGVNVPGGDGAVEVIDTATREVTGTARVGMRPFDVDVSPDGREVYATDHDSFDVRRWTRTPWRPGAWRSPRTAPRAGSAPG